MPFAQQYKEMSLVLLVVFVLSGTLTPLQCSRDKPVTMHDAYRHQEGHKRDQSASQPLVK